MKLICLLFFLPISFFAQQIMLKTSVDSTSVGTPVKIVYRLNSNKLFPWKKVHSTSFAAFTLESPKDSAEIEIIGDTLITNISGWQEFIVTVIPWDTGTVVLKSFKYELGDSLIKFPSDTLLVTTDFIEGNDGLIDIREKFSAPREKESVNSGSADWLHWLDSLLGLGLFSALLYWVWKKRVKRKNNAITFTPREHAINQLIELRQSKLWEVNQKDYYDKLSFILRTYVTETQHINLLDKTTAETTILLKKLGLKNAIVSKIEELLNSADLVKFAASTSSNAFAEDTLNSCIELINLLAIQEGNVE